MIDVSIPKTSPAIDVARMRRRRRTFVRCEALMNCEAVRIEVTLDLSAISHHEQRERVICNHDPSFRQPSRNRASGDLRTQRRLITATRIISHRVDTSKAYALSWLEPLQLVQTKPFDRPYATRPNMSEFPCQSVQEEYGNCSGGWPDPTSWASCQACVEVVTNDAFNLTDTSGEPIVAPTNECLHAVQDVCRYLADTCLPDACGPCAAPIQDFLPCRLEYDSYGQGIGCTFRCDGPTGSSATRGRCWPTLHEEQVGWMGLAVAAVWYLSRHVA